MRSSEPLTATQSAGPVASFSQGPRGLLNQAELGRDVGINQPQVHRFVNLMETSFQAIRLPAYAVNRTKRLIKAPKLYWCDTALALH